MIAISLLSLTLWVQHVDSGPAPFAGYQPGTSITMGATNTKLDSVTSADGTSIFKAPAGKHYLIIELSVKNISEKPINVFPSSDTYVKDVSGTVAYLTPYSLAQPFRAGQLLPGDTIKGQLSYLVAKDTVQKLYIDAIWSGGVVTFAVQ